MVSPFATTQSRGLSTICGPNFDNTIVPFGNVISRWHAVVGAHGFGRRSTFVTVRFASTPGDPSEMA